jgi:hypothetical protein
MRVRVVRILHFFHGWVSFIERLLAVHLPMRGVNGKNLTGCETVSLR